MKWSYHHQGENRYILRNEEDNCFQCLAIWARHANVVEFKAGECLIEADENICDIISPDLPLKTLARLGTVTDFGLTFFVVACGLFIISKTPWCCVLFASNGKQIDL